MPAILLSYNSSEKHFEENIWNLSRNSFDRYCCQTMNFFKLFHTFLTSKFNYTQTFATPWVSMVILALRLDRHGNLTSQVLQSANWRWRQTRHEIVHARNALLVLGGKDTVNEQTFVPMSHTRIWQQLGSEFTSWRKEANLSTGESSLSNNEWWITLKIKSFFFQWTVSTLPKIIDKDP